MIARPIPHECAPTGPAAVFAGTLQHHIPTLKTGRLILRGPAIGDFDTYADIIMSPRFPHSSGGYSREDAWADYCNYVAGWLLRGTGVWTIETPEGDETLGFILVGMEPGDQETELGWMLTEQAEGRGYAFEAAIAARDHALGDTALPSLVSYVDLNNHRSIKLAERLGARRDEIAESKFDEPILVYRHAKPGEI